MIDTVWSMVKVLSDQIRAMGRIIKTPAQNALNLLLGYSSGFIDFWQKPATTKVIASKVLA